MKQCWQRLNNFAGATFFEMRDLPLPMPTSWSRKEWPLIAAARFQLPLLIPATTSRCIYLDTDILVDLDIAELVDHDLHETDIAMVVDRGFVQFEDYLSKLGLSSKNYGNTGVVLIDLDSWRKQGAASGLIDMGMNMPTDLWFFDQDILNLYFKDRCTWLSTKWNVHQAGSSSVGCIRHFTGRVKPWHVSAATTEDIAFTAWHHILERSGYITKKTPRRVRLYKRFSAVFARAQRKLSTNRFDATPKVPHKP